MRLPSDRPAALVVPCRSLRFAAVLLTALLLTALRPVALEAQEPTAAAGVLRADQRRVSVTVATRALARGDTLRAEDIGVADTIITWRWNGVAPDTTRAQAGWITRRAIAVGEVLRLPAVTPPPVVATGATVTAIWQDGPLKLVMRGVATNTAAVGAPVGVRIDRTRRLDGIAVAPNTVRLR